MALSRSNFQLPLHSQGAAAAGSATFDRFLRCFPLLGQTPGDIGFKFWCKDTPPVAPVLCRLCACCSSALSPGCSGLFLWHFWSFSLSYATEKADILCLGTKYFTAVKGDCLSSRFFVFGGFYFSLLFLHGDLSCCFLSHLLFIWPTHSNHHFQVMCKGSIVWGGCLTSPPNILGGMSCSQYYNIVFCLTHSVRKEGRKEGERRGHLSLFPVLWDLKAAFSHAWWFSQEVTFLLSGCHRGSWALMIGCSWLCLWAFFASCSWISYKWYTIRRQKKYDMSSASQQLDKDMISLFLFCTVPHLTLPWRATKCRFNTWNHLLSLELFHEIMRKHGRPGH